MQKVEESVHQHVLVHKAAVLFLNQHAPAEGNMFAGTAVRVRCDYSSTVRGTALRNIPAALPKG